MGDIASPDDVWTWLVGGTCVDFKSSVACLLAFGADPDGDDIDQLLRSVVVDAMFGGLSGTQILLGLVLRECPKKSAEIHSTFLNSFHCALKNQLEMDLSPVLLHPEPARAIGSVCQRLFDAVKEDLGMFCILAEIPDAFRKRYIEP